jgi:hypothetical protein
MGSRVDNWFPSHAEPQANVPPPWLRRVGRVPVAINSGEVQQLYARHFGWGEQRMASAFALAKRWLPMGEEAAAGSLPWARLPVVSASQPEAKGVGISLPAPISGPSPSGSSDLELARTPAEAPPAPPAPEGAQSQRAQSQRTQSQRTQSPVASGAPPVAGAMDAPSAHGPQGPSGSAPGSEVGPEGRGGWIAAPAVDLGPPPAPASAKLLGQGPLGASSITRSPLPGNPQASTGVGQSVSPRPPEATPRLILRKLADALPGARSIPAVSIAGGSASPGWGWGPTGPLISGTGARSSQGADAPAPEALQQARQQAVAPASGDTPSVAAGTPSVSISGPLPMGFGDLPLAQTPAEAPLARPAPLAPEGAQSQQTQSPGASGAPAVAGATDASDAHGPKGPSGGSAGLAPMLSGPDGKNPFADAGEVLATLSNPSRRTIQASASAALQPPATSARLILRQVTNAETARSTTPTVSFEGVGEQPGAIPPWKMNLPRVPGWQSASGVPWSLASRVARGDGTAGAMALPFRTGHLWLARTAAHSSLAIPAEGTGPIHNPTTIPIPTPSKSPPRLVWRTSASGNPNVLAAASPLAAPSGSHADEANRRQSLLLARAAEPITDHASPVPMEEPMANGPDPFALAEQVARIVARRLEIERERRGGFNP